MMIFVAIRALMKTEADWTHQAKGLLKGELKRRNVSYQALSDVAQGDGDRRDAGEHRKQDQPGQIHGCLFPSMHGGDRRQGLHLEGE